MGFVEGLQIIPTLRPKVYTYYLHWASWFLRIGLRITGVGCTI